VSDFLIERYIVVLRAKNQPMRHFREVKSIHEKLPEGNRGTSVVILHESSIDVGEITASFNSIGIQPISEEISVINSYWDQEWKDIWVNSLKPNDCIFNPSASIDAAHLIRSLSSVEYFPKDEFGRKYPVGSKCYLVHSLPDLTTFDMYEFVTDQTSVKMSILSGNRSEGVSLALVLEGYEYDLVSVTSESIRVIEKCEREGGLDKASFNELLQDETVLEISNKSNHGSLEKRMPFFFEVAVASLIKSHYPEWEVAHNLELHTSLGVKAQEEDVIAYAPEKGILLWISCKYPWGNTKSNTILKEVERISKRTLSLKIPDPRIYSFVAVPRNAFNAYRKIKENTSSNNNVHVVHLGNLIPQIKAVLDDMD